MDLNISIQTLTKSFVYGFLLSGSCLFTYMIGYSVKSAFTLFNKIAK